MKKTKTLVVILLSLILVASLLAVTACDNRCKDGHTDDNHDGICDICNKEGLEINHDYAPATCTEPKKCACGATEGSALGHDWSDANGVCKVCGATCEHKTVNVECICTTCGALAHSWTYAEGVATCPNCELTCSEHTWGEDGHCTVCNYTCVDHIWSAEDEACSVCGKPCEHSYNAEFVCTICGNVCDHPAWANATCLKCGKVCADHQWSAEKEACAICGTPCDHDFNEDGLCGTCDYQCPHKNWTLGICDKCDYVCDHEEYSYGICKSCGINMGQSGKDSCSHNYVSGFCTICGSADPAAAATSKTYNLSASSLPTMWNVLNYQSNDATTVTGYTEDGFYSFDYNEDKTGYKMVPAMALDFPVEIPMTAELAEKWGFQADKDGNYEQYHIWKVELRHDLKFDNGDAITAEDYIETAKRLLDPKAANYRADSLYSGNMVIHNAENYLKQGSTQWVDITGGEGIGYDGVANWADATAEQLAAITFKTEGSFVVKYLQERNPGYDGSFLLSYFTEVPEDLLKAYDGKTAAEMLADETGKAILDALFGWWCTDAGEEFGFFTKSVVYPEVSWDEVGLYALDDYTLVFVLDKPLSGFYLHYSIGLPLVHVETYDKCASEEGGVYVNKYGTSVDTYVGHGPYKLITHVADSILQFTKNPYWYGHNEVNEFDETIYEATGIVIKQVVDEATRLQMFLKGELDSYGLQEADMKDYQSSDYTYYTEGDSTWFVALNPDMAGLTREQEKAKPVNTGYVVNKTVLTIKEFRQALSFSLNRAEYQLTLDPVGSVGKALYSGMIISDPENGITYRSTEQAKDTILAFWGLTNDVCPENCPCGGLEHAYATKDEAIDSITGYDPTGAKALFDKAYDLAVEQGLIPADAISSGKWEVQIMVGQPGTGSSTYYNKGYEYLSKIWTEAVVGTKFEGHLTFKQSEPLGSSNFSDYLKNNSIDLLFGVGWTGSALDPYSLIEAYVAPNYQYDPGWDTSKAELTIELPLKDGAYDEENGELTRLSGSVYDWHKTLVGEAKSFVVVDAEGNPVKDAEGNEIFVEINAGTSANATMRLIILAKIEQAVLEQYDMIPVGLDASASMKGARLEFETEEYVFGVGRGGLKYLDFEMTDAEWAAAVKAAGGQWNYKASSAE